MKKPVVIMLDESVHQHGKCGDPECPCALDESMPASPSLLINGQPASASEYKRLSNTPAQPARKEDLAQRPLQSVARPFQILR